MIERSPKLSLLDIPISERNQDWYQSLFEQRLKKQPNAQFEYFPSWQDQLYDEPENLISVIKSADAILYGHFAEDDSIDRFDVILSEQPGASEMSHIRTLKDLELPWENKNAMKGFFFQTSDNKRYLLLRLFEPHYLNAYAESTQTPDYVDKILDALQAYNISAALSDTRGPRGGEEFAVIADIDNDPIDTPQFDIEKQLWDGYTSKIAQFNGWTNRELLRFRVAGEWPHREPDKV